MEAIRSEKSPFAKEPENVAIHIDSMLYWSEERMRRHLDDCARSWARQRGMKLSKPVEVEAEPPAREENAVYVYDGENFRRVERTKARAKPAKLKSERRPVAKQELKRVEVKPKPEAQPGDKKARTAKATLSRSQKCYCVELDMEFESCLAAGRYIGADHTSICKCIKGKARTVKGYHFWRSKDQPQPMRPAIIKPKEIEVVCVETGEAFKTMTAAARSAGITPEGMRYLIRRGTAYNGKHYRTDNDKEK